MDELEIQFLGEIRVSRGAQELGLPPSRKTRGLLAFLAMDPRSYRREHLCELLWEIPDDPRGSLRWSLSKLRRLVDSDVNIRIVADRSTVAFEPQGVPIDALDLLLLVKQDLAALPLDELKHAADRYQGVFLEGLDLDNFHEFYTWCIGQREQVTQAQIQVLGNLVQRLQSEPEQALEYARKLAALAPTDEAAQMALIDLLGVTGREQEALQQNRQARHQLAEVGIDFSHKADRTRVHHSIKAPKGVDLMTIPAPRKEVMQYVSERIYGRDNEVRALVAGFDKVCEQSRAKLVLLRGEPGIGKSRMLQVGRDLAEKLSTCVLAADAFESEIVRPFALWNDAIRRNQHVDVPALFVSDVPESRDHVFAGLSELIATQCASGPVLVSFDDLQWCDESSAAALHYVMRMNRDRPLYVLAGAREAELRDNTPVNQAIRGLRHEGLLEDIFLGPLDAESICELIKEAAPKSDADRLATESGGNPLLAVELVRAEAAGDKVGSLAQLVRERLARLSDEAREVVLWASVLAPNIDRRTLEPLVGLTRIDLDAALESSQDQIMLVPAERGFRFSHDLIGSSVYQEISESRRQSMHLRIAEQLEVDTALNLQLAADLAHHASKSGDVGLAARAMVSAGRLCLRFYANEDALGLALTGLEHAAKLGDADRVCLSLELSDIRVAAAPVPDWEAAAAEYEHLAEQALDHGALPYARLGYQLASTLRWMHGDCDAARYSSLQAERVTRGGSAEEHILGMAETAKCLVLLEKDLPQADAMLMEARSLASRKNIVTPAIVQASGMLRYYEGELDTAEELLQEARTQFKARGERINEYAANEYLLMIDLERGDFQGAKSHCRALVELGGKVREGSELPYAQAVHCLLDRVGGGDAPGLDASLQALRLADAKFRLSYILNRVALLELEQCHYASALEHAGEALQCTQVLARASEMMFARTTLVLAHQALGQQAEMQEQLDALQNMESMGVARWALQRAEPLIRKGGA
ncbi:MAG: AAA family ATPase [Halioglobus sp.]